MAGRDHVARAAEDRSRAFRRRGLLSISFVGNAMLGSLRNKEALHSHCRDNRRLRGSLVCKLSHRRLKPRRNQYHRQSGLPRPDLSRLRRDRFLPADGAWLELSHQPRVLGRITGDRGLAHRHGPVGRDPGAARGARIRLADRRRADGRAQKKASASVSRTDGSQRARSLAARASYTTWRGGAPAR
jgi:hypothetical protein